MSSPMETCLSSTCVTPNHTHSISCPTKSPCAAPVYALLRRITRAASCSAGATARTYASCACSCPPSASRARMLPRASPSTSLAATLRSTPTLLSERMAAKLTNASVSCSGLMATATSRNQGEIMRHRTSPMPSLISAVSRLGSAVTYSPASWPPPPTSACSAAGVEPARVKNSYRLVSSEALMARVRWWSSATPTCESIATSATVTPSSTSSTTPARRAACHTALRSALSTSPPPAAAIAVCSASASYRLA